MCSVIVWHICKAVTRPASEQKRPGSDDDPGRGATLMATAASEQWCQQACPSWPLCSCIVCSQVGDACRLAQPCCICLLCTGGCGCCRGFTFIACTQLLQLVAEFSAWGGGVCCPCKSFQAAALRQCNDATRQLTRRGAVLSRHCRLICDACGQCADCWSVSDCHSMSCARYLGTAAPGVAASWICPV